MNSILRLIKFETAGEWILGLLIAIYVNHLIMTAVFKALDMMGLTK